MPDDLKHHVDTWEKSFHDWGDRATGPRADGCYDLIERHGDANGERMVPPVGKSFRAKAIVLTDASNSSASFGFVQLLEISGFATRVGTTTGGKRRGINGGAVHERRDGRGTVRPLSSERRPKPLVHNWPFDFPANLRTTALLKKAAVDDLLTNPSHTRLRGPRLERYEEAARVSRQRRPLAEIGLEHRLPDRCTVPQ